VKLQQARGLLLSGFLWGRVIGIDVDNCYRHSGCVRVNDESLDVPKMWQNERLQQKITTSAVE
jgi:hypothetical protein